MRRHRYYIIFYLLQILFFCGCTFDSGTLYGGSKKNDALSSKFGCYAKQIELLPIRYFDREQPHHYTFSDLSHDLYHYVNNEMLAISRSAKGCGEVRQRNYVIEIKYRTETMMTDIGEDIYSKSNRVKFYFHYDITEASANKADKKNPILFSRDFVFTTSIIRKNSGYAYVVSLEDLDSVTVSSIARMLTLQILQSILAANS